MFGPVFDTYPFQTKTFQRSTLTIFRLAMSHPCQKQDLWRILHKSVLWNVDFPAEIRDYWELKPGLKHPLELSGDHHIHHLTHPTLTFKCNRFHHQPHNQSDFIIHLATFTYIFHLFLHVLPWPRHIHRVRRCVRREPKLFLASTSVFVQLDLFGKSYLCILDTCITYVCICKYVYG